MAVSKLTRKESNELTRRRLVNGAIDLLRAHGVAAATTGRIAKAAGIKQSSFYAHFPDRDACLEAAAAEIGGQVLDRLKRQQGRVDPGDLRGSIRRIYGAMLAAFLSEQELTRLFLRHRSDDTSPLGRSFRHLLDLARAELVQNFHLYGLTSAPEPAHCFAELLVAATLGVLEAVLAGRVRDRELAVDSLTDVTFAALGALGPRS